MWHLFFFLWGISRSTYNCIMKVIRNSLVGENHFQVFCCTSTSVSRQTAEEQKKGGNVIVFFRDTGSCLFSTDRASAEYQHIPGGS